MEDKPSVAQNTINGSSGIEEGMVLKVAMFGAGGMGTNHARAYARMPGVAVVGVMDHNRDAADRLADAVGARGFTSAGEMFDTISFDIVDVCVPTPWHAEYVCLAAEREVAGIVVEKPMGRTIEDCDRMIEACQRRKIPLFPAHVLRFFPEFAAARRQVDSGVIGDVASVRTRRGGPFPRAWENWYGKPSLSGGVILDLIIHDFDWLRWTFGEVDRVFARCLSAGKHEVDKDYALVTLRFRSGVVGHVEGTWADPGGFKVGIEVAGREGLIELNFNQPASPAFTAAISGPVGAGPGVAVPENPTAESPYYLELEHFISSIRSGTPPAITAEDGRAAVQIAAAALESAETGRPVHIV